MPLRTLAIIVGVMVLVGGFIALLLGRSSESNRSAEELVLLRGDPIATFVPSASTLVGDDEMPACSDSDPQAKVVRVFETERGARDILAEIQPLLDQGRWIPASASAEMSELFETYRFHRRGEPATTLKLVATRAAGSDAVIAPPDWDIAITLYRMPSTC